MALQKLELSAVVQSALDLPGTTTEKTIPGTSLVVGPGGGKLGAREGYRVHEGEGSGEWGVGRGKEIDSFLCARAYACVHVCVHIASWRCTSLVARTTTPTAATAMTPTKETQAYLVVAGTG